MFWSSSKEVEALEEYGLIRYKVSGGFLTFPLAIHVLVFIRRFSNA